MDPSVAPGVKPSVLAVCFFSSPGPVADNFYTLCCALAQQTRLSVLTSSPLQDRAIPGAADTCYLDFPKQRPWRWLAPALWLRLLRYVRREPFDLAFLYSEHPVHLAVSVTSRARRALFWCLDPKPHSGSRTIPAMLYELAKRGLLRRADRVAVACHALKADLVARYGVPHHRVIVSFHGVLSNLAFPEIDAPIRDIDLLFFGRLEAYKGVDVLLEAVRRLRLRGRSPRVVVAGTGPWRVAEAPGVTIDDRYLPDRDLARLVARSRIVVLPYRDATGSQAPQTAFAYGTPVVASAVGCLAEYVDDGITGLLVPPGDAARLADALDRLLGDAELWNAMSRRAREAANVTFSNEPLTARLLDQALT